MREYSRQLMLFMEDFLADDSRSVWLESRKGQVIPVTSGRSFRGWSGSLDRVGYWLKTYLEYSSSRRTGYAPTWSVKATVSGFGIMKLRLSEHRTDGSGCFLWRTPDANCYRGANSKESYERRQKAGVPLSLNNQVAHMLPTPTANNAKNNGNASSQNRHTPPLDAVAGGSLNPEWVEWLQGFPQGWTETD